MVDEQRLQDLLLQWESLREAGVATSAQQLSPDDSSTRAELDRRIKSLQQLDWVANFNKALPVRSRTAGARRMDGPCAVPCSRR
jgi:hypothetical protein